MNTRVSSALATAKRKFAAGGDLFGTPDMTSASARMNWPQPLPWDEPVVAPPALAVRPVQARTAPAVSSALTDTVAAVAPPTQLAEAPMPSAWERAASVSQPAIEAAPVAPPASARTGAFDHLIPKQPATTAPATRTGAFDHLIPPQAPVAPVPDTPPADASAQSWTRYAGDLAQKAAQGVTFNFGDEIGAGIGSISNKAMRAAGVDVPEGTYETILSEIRGREKSFETANPKTAIGAEIAGALGSGIPAGMGVARVAARVPSLARLPGFVRLPASGAAAAAPFGAISETGKLEGDKSLGEYAEAAGEGALTAGAFGAGLSTAGGALARVAGPWASAAAQRLHDRGIRLTPGELIGGNAKRLEDVATSLPFVGALVRARQNAATESFNVAALNDVLRPIGAQLAPGTRGGHAAVAAAGDEISAAYRAVVPRLQGEIDLPLQRELANITNTLPPAMRADFDRFVQPAMSTASSGGYAGARIPGDEMQNLLGVLRAEATHLTTSAGSNFHDRTLGRAIGEAADAVEANMRRHTPTDVADDFAAANEAFANLVRVERAAGSVAAEGGVFTPAQLLNAVKATDRTARKRGFARGESLMQDLADDAKTVMTRKVADSGTPERAAIVGALAAPSAIPLAALTASPIAALYTGAGNRAFRALAAASPQTRELIRRLIQQGTDRAAPAAGLAATTGN